MKTFVPMKLAVPLLLLLLVGAGGIVGFVLLARTEPSVLRAAVMGSVALVALGTDRERFDSADEVATFSGIAPVTERSGQHTWVHWRLACSKFLRQSFHEFANMSRRQSVWANAYYETQRARGKSHHAALRALAFKWILIIYRCWKQREIYDEAKYLVALKKRNSPLVKIMAEAA